MTSNSGVITPSSTAQQALYEMMNGDVISNATGTSTTGTDGSSPPAYLTPESLMAYCQSRLQSIDSQVQTAMTQQQNADWEQSSIGNILTEIASDSAAATNGGMTNPQECQALEQKIEDLITQIQQRDPGCAQLGPLELLHDTVMATGTGPYPQPNPTHSYYSSNAGGVGGKPDGPTPPAGVNSDQDGTIGTNELTDFTNTLNNINSSLSSGAEIGMIQIQSLVSERTTAITLATSTLQSLDDGTQKIVDKIGS
jgi:hypothetical protein